jgi:hypothetical protein
MNISQEFADTIVLDTDGAEHPLGSLWATQTAVLVFLRHFG